MANGWNENQDTRLELGRTLIDNLDGIPENHREAPVCFRKRTLLKNELVDVVGRNLLVEDGPTSWTLTPSIVMDPKFKGNYREGTFGEAIFMHPPPSSEVVLNLFSLYQDNDFLSAFDSFSRRCDQQSRALRKIGNS